MIFYPGIPNHTMFLCWINWLLEVKTYFRGIWNLVMIFENIKDMVHIIWTISYGPYHIERYNEIKTLFVRISAILTFSGIIDFDQAPTAGEETFVCHSWLWWVIINNGFSKIFLRYWFCIRGTTRSLRIDSGKRLSDNDEIKGVDEFRTWSKKSSSLPAGNFVHLKSGLTPSWSNHSRFLKWRVSIISNYDI